MQNDNPNQLPIFLLSFENLTEHFASHFDALNSNDRGDKFLDVARKFFERCYLLSCELLASTAIQAWTKERGSDFQVTQEMYKRVSQPPFEAFYAQLRISIDADNDSIQPWVELL